jgi:hypothetical protein
MFNYIKSEKGYFYKISKNGEKTRISKEEYVNKNIKSKTVKKGGSNSKDEEEIDYFLANLLIQIVFKNIIDDLNNNNIFYFKDKINSLKNKLSYEKINFVRTNEYSPDYFTDNNRIGNNIIEYENKLEKEKINVEEKKRVITFLNSNENKNEFYSYSKNYLTYVHFKKYDNKDLIMILEYLQYKKSEKIQNICNKTLDTHKKTFRLFSECDNLQKIVDIVFINNNDLKYYINHCCSPNNNSLSITPFNKEKFNIALKKVELLNYINENIETCKLFILQKLEYLNKINKNNNSNEINKNNNLNEINNFKEFIDYIIREAVKNNIFKIKSNSS